MSRNRILTSLCVIAAPLGILALSAGPASARVSGPAFYVEGQLYRTVGTPTDLSSTGAPDHTFDTIYVLADQKNVANAAPGVGRYNGGRWQAHDIAVPDYDAALAAGDLDHDGVLDSEAEVRAAIDAGAAIDNGVVSEFVCTVVKLPANQR